MSKIKGKLEPLRDKVFLSDINFDEETTAGGILLTSDNGKGGGVKPRWGRVWAVGPDQKDVKVGEWILMEHARWTREFIHEAEDGTLTSLHMADLNGMMLSADQKPMGADRGVAAAAGGNFNFNIPG
jgi:co-chaperonin GroES (HSP10)